MTRFKYAGIGPRLTPIDICEVMYHAAVRLNQMGWTLRSGHAEGADQAWEAGHLTTQREIYLPWPGFNRGNGVGMFVSPDSEELRRVASEVHPAWSRISVGAQKLMMRNVAIMLGPQLNDHVKFATYWSADRKVQGGTGNALRLASLYGIPSFNIAFAEDQDAMVNFVNELTPEPD